MQTREGFLHTNICKLLVLLSVFSACGSSGPKEQRPIDRSRIERAFAELDGRQTDKGKVSLDREVKADSRTGGDPPSWVPVAPPSNLYHQGVGSDIDGWESATAKALGDLSRQIEVQVVTEVRSVIRENGYSAGVNSAYTADNYFTSEVTLLSKQTVSDYEVVERWKGQGKYWVYLRLSQAVFRDKLARELTDARELALDYWNFGKAAEKKGDVVGALKAYVNGMCAIRKFLGQPIRITVAGQSIIISSELHRDLARLARAVDIVATSPTNVMARPGVPINQSVSIRAEHGGRPLAGLPISFDFVKGQGQLVENSTTGRNGSVTSKIYGVKSDEVYSAVRASIDLQYMTGLSVDQLSSMREALESIGISSVLFHISTAQRRIFVAIDEDNLGYRVQNSFFASHLKDTIADNIDGVTFTDSIEGATLLVKGNITSRFSSKMGNINFCYATVFVSLVDKRTGEELYSSKLDRVKGIHLNQVEAGHKSIENASKEVVVELANYIQREFGL